MQAMDPTGRQEDSRKINDINPSYVHVHDKCHQSRNTEPDEQGKRGAALLVDQLVHADAQADKEQGHAEKIQEAVERNGVPGQPVVLSHEHMQEPAEVMRALPQNLTSKHARYLYEPGRRGKPRDREKTGVDRRQLQAVDEDEEANRDGAQPEHSEPANHLRRSYSFGR